VHVRLNERALDYEKRLQSATEAAEKAIDDAHVKEDGARAITIIGKPLQQKVGQFQPVITERSQRKHREYHDFLAWGDEQKKKHEELREKFEELAMSEVRPAPTISQRSRKLAEKQDREGKVEDTLIAWKDKKASKLKEKEIEVEEEKCPHHPQITNYAASLQRDGDVGDRLYNKAFEYRSKREDEIERQMQEIEEMARGGHRSPRRVASYSYEHQREPEARNLPIELDLQRRDEEKKAAREAMLAEQEEEEALMHYPRINAMSDLIASQLPENAVERLLKPKASYQAPEEDDPSWTFRPKVNPRSVEINKEKLLRGEVGADRNQYLYDLDEENKYRMEQARKRALAKEMEECTFQPNINRESHALPTSNHSVVARTQQWQKQRNARMRQEREMQEKKEMQECTFRPNIAQYKPKKKKAQKQGAYGTDTHVERQNIARKQKEDAAVIPHSTGQHWQNKLTEPQEFSFSHKVKIKALKKPMSPRLGEAEIEKKALTMSTQPSVHDRTMNLSPSMESNGTASAEWMRRAAEKEMSEQAHAAAGMNSPRFYASDALNVHTGTPRARTGEDAHIQRLKQARVERETSSKASASTTGENWTNRTTVPQEFKFTESKQVRVKSLHKPVAPMVFYS